MKKKVFLILTIMFSSQLFFSCIDCDCDDKIFENFYTAVFIEPFYRAQSATEGERITINEDDIVSKDNFSFILRFDLESNEIANMNILNKLSDFGFTTAYASIDCFCEENYKQTYPDQVREVTIYSFNTSTNERIDVTNNFDFQNYDDEFISINSIIDSSVTADREINSLDFILINPENITNTTVFEVEAELNSGTILTYETEEINFQE